MYYVVRGQGKLGCGQDGKGAAGTVERKGEEKRGQGRRAEKERGKERTGQDRRGKGRRGEERREVCAAHAESDLTLSLPNVEARVQVILKQKPNNVQNTFLS